jgi:transposase
MSILWEEYREVHSEGYGYSRFCDLLRGFERMFRCFRLSALPIKV